MILSKNFNSHVDLGPILFLYLFCVWSRLTNRFLAEQQPQLIDSEIMQR